MLEQSLFMECVQLVKLALYVEPLMTYTYYQLLPHQVHGIVYTVRSSTFTVMLLENYYVIQLECNLQLGTGSSKCNGGLTLIENNYYRWGGRGDDPCTKRWAIYYSFI